MVEWKYSYAAALMPPRHLLLPRYAIDFVTAHSRQPSRTLRATGKGVGRRGSGAGTANEARAVSRPRGGLRGPGARGRRTGRAPSAAAAAAAAKTAESFLAGVDCNTRSASSALSFVVVVVVVAVADQHHSSAFARRRRSSPSCSVQCRSK